MPRYRVTGPFPFGEHAPDSIFEAETDERIERAVKRGSISESSTPPETPAPVETSAPVVPAPTPTPSTSTDPTPKSPTPHAGHVGGHKKKE